MPSIAYLGVSIKLHTTKLLVMHKKETWQRWDFSEPTPPKRLVPKTSALDRSATLADGLNIGAKHCKSGDAYYLTVSKRKF